MTPTVKLPHVKEMMTGRVLGIPENYSILDALTFFNKHRISMAPIIQSTRTEKADGKNILGVLTQSKIAKYLMTEIFHDEFQAVPVTNVMLSSLPFAQDSWDIFELEEFFRNNDINHTLVQNSEKQLVGVVSKRDVLVKLEGVAVEFLNYKRNLMEPVELTKIEKILLQFTFKGER